MAKFSKKQKPGVKTSEEEELLEGEEGDDTEDDVDGKSKKQRKDQRIVTHLYLIL
jgi:hypothetical protein